MDLSAEGLVVDQNGNPVQGLTSATSRNEFPLGLWGKRTIELKDCLNARGEIDFWGDFTCMDIEGQYRNNGRIKEACLVWVDDLVRETFYDWVVARAFLWASAKTEMPTAKKSASFWNGQRLPLARRRPNIPPPMWAVPRSG